MRSQLQNKYNELAKLLSWNTKPYFLEMGSGYGINTKSYLHNWRLLIQCLFGRLLEVLYWVKHIKASYSAGSFGIFSKSTKIKSHSCFTQQWEHLYLWRSKFKQTEVQWCAQVQPQTVLNISSSCSWKNAWGKNLSFCINNWKLYDHYWRGRRSRPWRHVGSWSVAS